MYRNLSYVWLDLNSVNIYYQNIVFNYIFYSLNNILSWKQKSTTYFAISQKIFKILKKKKKLFSGVNQRYKN